MTMRIIFFDTETTGTGENDRLCQLGIKERGVDTPIINELFKPPIPIAYEAMAVHHITQAMVNDRPAFRDAPEYGAIKELFESPDVIAVAHNAAFDIGVLEREGITPANTICTLKVVRALDTESVFTNYKLQYLRYRLDIDVPGVVAHDAWGDVVVLEKLFDRLFSKYTEQAGTEEDAIAAMKDISQKPSLLRVINFGKYRGQKVSELATTDPSYLEWLLFEKRKNPAGEEDWIYTLEQALHL